MSDITNKTLFLLLVLVVAISLAGTFVSLNKLGQIGLTGLQTSNVTQQTGITSVTLLGAVQLTIYNNTIVWGSGQINGSVSAGIDFCNLTTNGSITSSFNTFAFTGGGQTAACDGFNVTTPWSMVLENTGSNAFDNVTMAATNGDADFKTKFDASAQFLWRLEEEDNANACFGATGETSSYTAVATTATGICDIFQANPNAEDSFMIQLRFSVPENSTADTFTDTLTFIGNV